MVTTAGHGQVVLLHSLYACALYPELPSCISTMPKNSYNIYYLKLGGVCPHMSHIPKRYTGCAKISRKSVVQV